MPCYFLNFKKDIIKPFVLLNNLLVKENQSKENIYKSYSHNEDWENKRKL